MYESLITGSTSVKVVSRCAVITEWPCPMLGYEGPIPTTGRAYKLDFSSSTRWLTGMTNGLSILYCYLYYITWITFFFQNLLKCGWSPDGRYIAAASSDRSVEIFFCLIHINVLMFKEYKLFLPLLENYVTLHRTIFLLLTVF